MTERTVTALYDARTDAEAARARLIDIGMPAGQITLHTQNGEAANRTEHEEGFWASLKELFVPDEHRHAYAEGLRRGGVLLWARAPETLVDSAVQVLEHTNAVDVETRATEWREAGWSGYGAQAAGSGTAALAPVPPGATAVAQVGSMRQSQEGQSQTSSLAGQTATDTEEAIALVQEEPRVGKREVDRGSVRVRSYLVETPVEEQVRLRDETVHVERRPVERELRAGDMAAFQEKTIELTETDEEAVVAKTARVTEEVVVRKDVTEHAETIRDTVRHTEVEVEDTRTGRSGPSTAAQPRPSQQR